jgi:uncharacterized protein YndB with AHSA1/START domain
MEQPVAPNQIISKTIDINAPASTVWAALTEPAIMKSWMTEFEMDIISSWQPNTPLIVRGNLHGIPYENKGTILQSEPESVLQYTYWSSLSQHADIPENYSLITFQFSSPGNTTTLTFTQSNFQTDIIYKHFNYYWTIALELMKKVSERGA